MLYLGTHYMGMVETNFLISTFAEYKEVDSYISIRTQPISCERGSQFSYIESTLVQSYD